jgi:5-formyltetrahydrofolate cyclo-ligase
MDKQELRRHIRQLKKSYAPESLQQQSRQILYQLSSHPDFQQAEHVMLYASLPDEVQTLDFIEEWKKRKHIILPTVVGDDIIPVELTADCPMVEGSFHILEPQSNQYAGPLDLIVVPGMAFDRQGHRLGRGKGYYDRFLIKYPEVKTIGICFDFQLLDEVPAEPHDQLIDEIISL